MPYKIPADIIGESGSIKIFAFKSIAGLVMCQISEDPPQWVPLDEILNDHAKDINKNTDAIAALTETVEQGGIGEKGEKGDKGDKGDTGAQGEKGEPGAQGEKGERGDSGVVAPIAGFFTMYVDENSDLYAIVPSGGMVPLEYDPETGNLYYLAWRVNTDGNDS